MVREGGERLRLFPGQHAAQLAFTGAQRDGQQRILLRRQARPGEADQRAAGAHPGFQRLTLLRIGQFTIRQDQHGKPPCQQRFRRAAAKFGEGVERAQQIKKRADQRRIGAGILSRSKPHRAAAEAFIQQEHPSRTGFRFQFQPHHLVANFAWELEHRLGHGGTRGQGQLHPREAGAIPAAREDRGLAGQSHRSLDQLEPQPIPFQNGRRQQPARFGRGMDQRERPGLGQGGKEGRRILARAMFQTIGQEQAFKAARVRGA